MLRSHGAYGEFMTRAAPSVGLDKNLRQVLFLDRSLPCTLGMTISEPFSGRYTKYPDSQISFPHSKGLISSVAGV
jgi:hypothetical protein